ncbi:hypothetical protein BJ166DRAFT_67702 [Pestalotiopsis sp. NC0098]|nr:hypothetical protein BJ166DRAFT_67702 [Pestalotiopsis sp. NC0098]
MGHFRGQKGLLSCFPCRGLSAPLRCSRTDKFKVLACLPACLAWPCVVRRGKKTITYTRSLGGSALLHIQKSDVASPGCRYARITCLSCIMGVWHLGNHLRLASASHVLFRSSAYTSVWVVQGRLGTWDESSRVAEINRQPCSISSVKFDIRRVAGLLHCFNVLLCQHMKNIIIIFIDITYCLPFIHISFSHGLSLDTAQAHHIEAPEQRSGSTTILSYKFELAFS